MPFLQEMAPASPITDCEQQRLIDVQQFAGNMLL